MSTVFLNGEYLPQDRALISVDDRGFLLSDGIYEVTPAYRGVLFRFGEHYARMKRGLGVLRIDYDPEPLVEVHRRLLEANGVEDAECALVYVQITRGVAPRTHWFPDHPVPPTVYAFAKAWQRPSRERWEQGFTACSVPDRRWAHVDVKTISLLPNVLAYQDARERGGTDALLVRDGFALEGAHNNFFAVFEGTVVTHPTSNVILPGITRREVIRLARAQGIPVEERAIPVETLAHADEMFFTGTTSEVRPTVELDGRPVGSGRVGPVARALYDAFLASVEATIAETRATLA